MCPSVFGEDALGTTVEMVLSDERQTAITGFALYMDPPFTNEYPEFGAEGKR
jgi:hypothetical protein